MYKRAPVKLEDEQEKPVNIKPTSTKDAIINLDLCILTPSNYFLNELKVSVLALYSQEYSLKIEAIKDEFYLDKVL